MDSLKSRETFRMVGKVERLNRQAVAVGQNGKIRGGKSIIQLKPVGLHQWQIRISVVKDLDGQRYDVAAIQKLRVNFVNEGKLTIELKQPPMSLMLQDCKVEDLSFFVQKLEYIKKTADKLKSMPEPTSTTIKGDGSGGGTVKVVVPKRENSSSPSSSSRKRDDGVVLRPLLKSTSSLNVLDNDVMKEDRVSATTKEGRGLKRAHTDMSNKEAASLRKVLRLHTTNLVVKERSEYPLKGLPESLQRIVFQGIQLKRIDSRLCDLVNLRILSLENNRISSIESLANLKSCIESLNLSSNLIDIISESVFRSRALSKLQQLNLNHNQLKTLPNSLCTLQYLKDLQVSNNLLLVLPYNVHHLKTLGILKLNNNKLKSLPFPVSKLRLDHLDVSANPFISNQEPPRKVQLEREPTLFEVAGATLLSQLYKDKLKSKDGNDCKLDISDPSTVPQSISDHLHRAKYCYRCGNIHLRYTLVYNQIRHDFALEAVSSLAGRFIPMCEAVCDRCLLVSENIVI